MRRARIPGETILAFAMMVPLFNPLSMLYGLTLSEPFYPSEIEPPCHTHAFDIYCHPFEGGSSPTLAPLALAKLRENLDPVSRVGLTILESLAVIGLVLRMLNHHWHVEVWLERPSDPSGSSPGWLNISIPPPALGRIALGGLVVFSIVGCFAYYPSPREVFDEMPILRGEVLSAALSGNQKHATYLIPVWDDWTRRLQVGTFLREARVGGYLRMKAKIFRDRLSSSRTPSRKKIVTRPVNWSRQSRRPLALCERPSSNNGTLHFALVFSGYEGMSAGRR